MTIKTELSGDSSATQGHTNSNLLDLYRTMRRIRTFEERVGELFIRGQSAGSMLHLSIGEESTAAGVCDAMQPQDTFTTHHRGHGIFLARGADPKQMMAEIGGKETGYCKGKGGSMHIADMALGHLGANAIVGGGIPAVVGAGLSSKYFNKGSVSIAFFGDGAMQQGILYESMNMAALWDLPVLFVCINNQYGMGTRVDQATRNTAFDQRAKAFGLNGAVVDGLDVEAVQSAARWLVDDARGGKPGFLSIDVYRFFGHARMDKSPYRQEEEELEGRKKDPVRFARDRLIETGLEKEAFLDDLDKAIAAEMDATIDFSVDSKAPPLSSMFRDVYAVGEPEPEPVRTRIDRVLARDEA
ncbi:thiamine pyrophosphate-dependent dehydrogenase E1 component subunit alpha [Rhizobium sp. PL01]|uniref:thiamine pyrophosphate-dependent dehydrogenase E1 component subunit alpha n=1 Tax=Rhizobium sp. PL01 TaxID=3085631 RepID=UPI00298259F6|nr:thiamine pyrophosphate-dependent dehydrogenase E1 component subunit alpha [Rhizobium sp. PL01]MDW5318462.1 thiamine pyrophosphate-dependent dehydrogenase E1 component subunit alpha [Rhizobium sp. PL01]